MHDDEACTIPNQSFVSPFLGVGKVEDLLFLLLLTR